MPYNPDGSFSLTYTFGTGTPPNNMFPPQVGNSLSDMATSIAIPNIATQAAFISVIAATLATKAGVTQKDFISGVIAVPATGTYYLLPQSPFGVVITSFGGFTGAGTVGAYLQIQGVSVTGSAVTLVSSGFSSATVSSGNTVASGNNVALVVTLASGATNGAFIMDYNRSLAQ